jgi:hypothetical protein
MREVEDICRSDEFRTFNRSTGQQIPELFHERQTKRMAFLRVLGRGVLLLSQTCRPSKFRCAEMVFPQLASSVIGFTSRRPAAMRFHVTFHTRDDGTVRPVPSR